MKIRTVCNNKVLYETNYKIKEKQVQKAVNYNYESLTNPSVENFQAVFLGIKSTQKGPDKGLITKAITQLGQSFDLSQSTPKEVAIYIESKDNNIFANCIYEDKNDTYTVTINEGKVSSKKIQPFSVCLNVKGEIITPNKAIINSDQTNALNIMIDSIITNDSNILKRVPKAPIITREKLHNALIRMGPKHLKPLYRGDWLKDNPTNGYCYVVSEVIYHYLAPEGSNPKVVKLSPEKTHWWIEAKDGTILDGTSEQFKNGKIPYHQGRNNSFLTNKPSKRARILAKELGLIDTI